MFNVYSPRIIYISRISIKQNAAVDVFFLLLFLFKIYIRTHTAYSPSQLYKVAYIFFIMTEDEGKKTIFFNYRNFNKALER